MLLKLNEIIKEDWLFRKEYGLFNLESNWNVIHRGKVYRLSRQKDQVFFEFETGKYNWDFAVKHITRSLNDTNQHLLLGEFNKVEIEVDEVVEEVYIDGEKIKLV